MIDFSLIGPAILTALTLDSFIGVGGGVLLGYVIGVIPGLSRSVAIAIAIPLTFYMTPYIAISFLIGLSKGTAAGSAVSAILLNAPGEASSAATCLDGYPMAQGGRPRTALKIGLLASVIGDVLATILLIAVAIPFARVALMFGPYEMAAILAFALVFIAGLSGGSLFKGLAAGGLGILLGSVGLDPQSGLPRMTFGYTELMDGMPLLAVAIGTLALSEMFIQADALRDARRGGPVALGVAAFAACSAAVGAPLGWGQIAVAPLAMLAMLIPASVGGWGWREGAAAALWPLVGHDAAAGFAASVAYGLAALTAAAAAPLVEAGTSSWRRT